jgi:hypothetical protein
MVIILKIRPGRALSRRYAAASAPGRETGLP